MRYTDEEIMAADAALQYMNERRGNYVDSTDLFTNMDHNNLVRNIMVEDLGLMAWHGAQLRLTDQGRLAAEKGFAKYIKDLDREKVEVVVERRLSITNGIWGLVSALLCVLTFLLGLLLARA